MSMTLTKNAASRPLIAAGAKLLSPGRQAWVDGEDDKAPAGATLKPAFLCVAPPGALHHLQFSQRSRAGLNNFAPSALLCRNDEHARHTPDASPCTKSRNIRVHPRKSAVRIFDLCHQCKSVVR